MRVKELQISPDVSAFIDACRGEQSRAAFIHSILKAAADAEAAKNINQPRRIISNDTTNNKAR